MKILETNWLLSRLDISNRLPSKSSPGEVELQQDLSFVRAIVIVGFLVGLGGLFGYAGGISPTESADNINELNC